MKKILSISYHFFPNITPTTIRASKIMQQLEDSWSIEVVTKAQSSHFGKSITVHSVPDWYPKSLAELVNTLKLTKLWTFFLPFSGEVPLFWVIPAILKARELIRQEKPDAIVVFMMPYSVGLVGLILKWLTGIPVIFNFDDSPTCTDMSGNSFESWFHYQLTVWMEDFYIRNSAATIYVSQRNLDRIKLRQSDWDASKLHLVRYGADREDFNYSSDRETKDYFQIAYIGFMGGWFEYYQTEEEQQKFWRRLYRFWNKLGQYKVLELDIKTSSPMFIGKAVKEAIADRPEWEGQIKIDLYGTLYPSYVTDRALANQNLSDAVFVHDAVPNKQAMEIACSCDLLFMTLPARPDDAGPGGRISAKTYEYLMTDRPILAAVSPGENYDYLEGNTGVWLVNQRDIAGMKEVITQLASEKFSGNPRVCDRSSIHDELSYANRAVEFANVLDTVISKYSSDD
ncbi:glycosyltransferase [Roseofilum casamattae]|uniref:Glycosyltransferase n=1 Tax=Roseofilum casamattae BLCC-M143 TaxID=3022442 RepID=A0ABT7C0V3_9CYAN|nr:glycosyltransferase [Roseofilum casamattae]MDJ1185084.1 glycosyltransferase [Roseofilum casamattae BLCC-M143]